jgi:hypothetical protein
LLWVGLATAERVAVITGVKVQEGLKTKVGINSPERRSAEGRKSSERTPATKKTAFQYASERLSKEGPKESERSNEEGTKMIGGWVAEGGKASEYGGAEGRQRPEMLSAYPVPIPDPDAVSRPVQLAVLFPPTIVS